MIKKAIKFSATWCGPCKIVAPHFQKMKEEFSDFEFEELDVDENRDICIKYKVTSVPTILLLENDEVVDRLVGAVNIAAIRSSFNKVKNGKK